MFHANRPACGAPVELKSVAAVMVVCSFCRSTLLRNGETPSDIDKMSVVLGNYTRVQIGTAGRYRNRVFTVVGRIQLCYDAGSWSEWYILFGDGTDGRLAEVSRQVTMTFARGTPVNTVTFEALRPGQLYDAEGTQFALSDVREADCVGGQGELPFHVDEGWHARVAGGRREGAFIMLDYSDGTAPALYVGEATTLNVLKCQLLRTGAEIKGTAGRVPGKLTNLNCPQRGTSIPFSPDVTGHVLCPGCGTAIDVATPRNDVIARARSVPQVATTLELGDKALINGLQWQVISVMRRAVVDSGGEWFEYLLYTLKRGFSWVAETSDGWFRANMLDHWPTRSSSRAAVLDDKIYARDEDYTACVTYAAGAFNWRVQSGDQTRAVEYTAGQDSLATENDAHELTWSKSTLVSAAQIKAWLGRVVAEPAKASSSNYMTVTVVACVLLGLLNLVSFFMAPGSVFGITLFAALLLLVPAWMVAKIGGGK